MTNEILTHAKVKELFDYDGAQLIWKVGGQGRQRGKPAGSYDSNGYRKVSIDKKVYRMHRVIWLHVYGEFPPNDTDHINGIRDDNRIENLRAVTRSENCRNAKKSIRNSSGITGVHWDKKNQKWMASITLDGQAKNLGRFDGKYEAASIRHFAMEIEGNYTARHGK